MRRQRADLLLAVSIPVLLVAGLLPWQRNEQCTMAGCGSVEAGAWSGSPAWALPLLAGLAVAGLWVLSLPTRGRASTAVAVLTATVAVLATATVLATLDALLFGRAGPFRFDLPVVADFPVLAVRPAEGLAVGLAGLLLQAVAGWSTLRRRGALVATPPGLPSRPHPQPAPPVGFGQGAAPGRRRHGR